MANYQKLTNSQLHKFKLKSAAKIETRLGINKKNFQEEELSLELFLTTR